MATKRNYYFEIQDTEKILGGVYYESTPLTEYQAYTRAIKMGREFLRNTPDAKRYSVFLTCGEDGEDIVFMVDVVRCGRALNARVWDCRQEKYVVDTQNHRIESLMKQCESHLEAIGIRSEK